MEDQVEDVDGGVISYFSAKFDLELEYTSVIRSFGHRSVCVVEEKNRFVLPMTTDSWDWKHRASLSHARLNHMGGRWEENQNGKCFEVVGVNENKEIRKERCWICAHNRSRYYFFDKLNYSKKTWKKIIRTETLESRLADHQCLSVHFSATLFIVKGPLAVELISTDHHICISKTAIQFLRCLSRYKTTWVQQWRWKENKWWKRRDKAKVIDRCL